MARVGICCCLLALVARAEGDVALFNGENLDGWVNVNCAPSTWTVRDGMIVCSGFPTGVLRTEKQYENFVLEISWRHTRKGGNAGLFVWSEAMPVRGRPFPKAIECQIMDGNHGDVFAIQGATMEPMRSRPSEERARPAGEWNSYRVECKDGKITLAVNGAVVARGSKCSPSRGYICLESEGSEVHFRTIRITGTPVEAETEDFRPLYNGVDLAGWTDDPGHKGHWQPKDWILDYDGKSEASDRNLWTKAKYDDFVLVADWRFTRKPVPRQRPVITEQGLQAEGEKGKWKTVEVMDAGDSGIYLRGSRKCQINIWCWPIGSGDPTGFRKDARANIRERIARTPKVRADNPPGEWNRFVITMKGARLTVVLNGKTVIDNARLRGVRLRGAIGLQHNGDPIQFANLYILKLTD